MSELTSLEIMRALVGDKRRKPHPKGGTCALITYETCFAACRDEKQMDQVLEHIRVFDAWMELNFGPVVMPEGFKGALYWYDREKQLRAQTIEETVARRLTGDYEVHEHTVARAHALVVIYQAVRKIREEDAKKAGPSPRAVV